MKKSFTKFLTLFLFVSLFINSTQAQFLKTKGTDIVDQNGNPFILKGMGLGGWMLQEGYMLETGDFAGNQTQIKQTIANLIGTQNTEDFYTAWRKNHCTREDVYSLASWGFNSIRLPMHYNLFTLSIQQEPIAGQDTWLTTGFTMVDSLLNWCKANKMYLILDLHAAPGGQGKDGNISDYNPAYPSLWESAENRRKTIMLWKKLAQRYANEPYIGGYDLINETNWSFGGDNPNGCSETDNKELKQLYKDITVAIRSVDTKHIIFVEGNCWANNFNGILPAWDNNMALSFHKYWNATDASSIQGFLDMRKNNNIPLWMGESGENSDQWFYETIKMLEQNNIGWSWWPMKKINSVVGPLTIVKTPEYQTLLDYWSGKGTKPELQFAKDALMQITENLKIKNCIYHPEVTDAMFRQQHDSTSISYKKAVAPGRVYAADYDMGQNNVAYYDMDAANTGGLGSSEWNKGWVYRNDGVDIAECTDVENKLGYAVAWIDDGEWMNYTIDIQQEAVYKLMIRYATSSNAAKIHFELDGKALTKSEFLPTTGDNSNYSTLYFSDVQLSSGKHTLKMRADKGGFNFGYFELIDPRNSSVLQPEFLYGETSFDGYSILLYTNKDIDKSVDLSTDFFSVTANSQNLTLESVKFDEKKNRQINLRLVDRLSYTDLVNIAYEQDIIKDLESNSVKKDNNITVINTVEPIYKIPGKIEAENFINNVGYVVESSSDNGGGFDLGYTDAGDYAEYKVNVLSTGLYNIDYRVASDYTTGGKLELYLNDSATTNLIQLISIPYTQGWQVWKTVSVQATLQKGYYIMKLSVNQSSFNLNWINFTQLTSTGMSSKNIHSLNIWPTPATDYFFFETPATNNEQYRKANLMIYSMIGKLIYKQNFENESQVQKVNTTGLDSGLYLVQFTNGSNFYQSKLIIE
jgi:aryl-phospho-beta-D-glucosidase BglC (GH1 family)